MEPEALALLKGDVTSGSAALSADSTMETDSSDDDQAKVISRIYSSSKKRGSRLVNCYMNAKSEFGEK